MCALILELFERFNIIENRETWYLYLSRGLICDWSVANYKFLIIPEKLL